MIAVSSGHEEVVQLLLSHGANVNHVNEIGVSSLHYAASKNRLRIASLLLNAGALVNAVDQRKQVRFEKKSWP